MPFQPGHSEDVSIRATLIALTPEAVEAIQGEQTVCHRFPFRVGAESRRGWQGLWTDAERRVPHTEPLNHLYLREPVHSRWPYIARGHFLIDHQGGRFYLVDRGTEQGTWVSGQQVGGGYEGGHATLRDQDVIAIGAETSPYLFEFRTSASVAWRPPRGTNQTLALS